MRKSEREGTYALYATAFNLLVYECACLHVTYVCTYVCIFVCVCMCAINFREENEKERVRERESVHVEWYFEINLSSWRRDDAKTKWHKYALKYAFHIRLGNPAEMSFIISRFFSFFFCLRACHSRHVRDGTTFSAVSPKLTCDKNHLSPQISKFTFLRIFPFLMLIQ